MKYEITKEKKKRFKIWQIILIIILLLLIGLASYVGFFIWSKLSKINYESIDKSDLDINENLYNEVSDNVSKKEFDDIRTIALFGTDSRDSNNMYAGRSDTIIIASINPKNKSIKLISIPRDTYVNIPGRGMDKINHAYAFGKEQLSIKTINNNFGLNISEYITIDFSGLIHIIDSIGGVELNITEAEKNYINSGVSKKISSSGKVTLNGEQALQHSRNRTVGNDFARASRQRDVLEAIINKLSNKDMSEISRFCDIFLPQVKTNMNVTGYLDDVALALTQKDSYLKNIYSVQIPSLNYSRGQMIDGVYYFTTDLNKAKGEFIEYIYNK